MDRIDKLLAEMTLEEKVAMCAGSGAWHSTGVERLGIPPIKVTDGPNGARGDMVSGCSAACFPVGSAIAATWNVELIEQLGAALGQEARSKGAQVLLGPTVNLHRHPLNGRHFECYSEDPLLTSRVAVAFVHGVQSERVGGCIKHFVANDSEFERFTISSEVAERPLRELYLVPFEAAVKESGVWSVMSAYNRINGIYASSHRELLTEVLKNEWGFDGFVVSDWGASRETVANTVGGLDLEMPGPARTMGDKLLEAIHAGEVDAALLDDKVRRLLRATIRTGRLDEPEEKTERAEDQPEHRALARRVARESFVLAKNDGLLPLDAGALRKLAVIGPNAALGRIQGGGSSIVKPHYEVHPLAAIRELLGDAVEVTSSVGCYTDKYVLPIPGECLSPAVDAEENGLRLEYRNGEGFEGEPLSARVVSGGQVVWMVPPEGVDLECFSARYSGIFTAAESGVHTFGLMSAGLSRMLLDGAVAIDNWSEQRPGDAFFGFGCAEDRCEVELREGQVVEICVEYQRDDRGGPPAVQFGCLPPSRQDRIDEAVELVGAADAAVVVVGTNGEWESEGHDRASLALPGRQVELIERVVRANPRTVVVLNAGSPVDLAWLDSVPALLQVWFAGQEFGHALTDVLFGESSPSGKLPTTWPVRLEDTPAFTCYPGENGKVEYGEGLFIGYRWYDARQIEPRLPFGHGLSYTTFEYGELSVPEAIACGSSVDVAVEIRNNGDCRGQEVVQLYVSSPASRLVRPEQELKGFAKVDLEPGESRRVAISLDARAFSYWDPAAQDWVVDAGDVEIRVGSSSRDIRTSAPLRLEEAGAPS